MTNYQILENAIKKATDRGWEPQTRQDGREVRIDPRLIDWKKTLPDHAYWLIFNHEFSKALWGEPRINAEPVAVLDGGNTIEFEAIEGWQFHLQQMAIAADPIAYLGEHL